jgi:hypothetical protein
MWEYKPVMITKGSFAFCRYTIAIMVWLALLLQDIWFIAAVTLIMVLSAILKVQRAPLVWLYASTVDRVMPSAEEVVNEKGIYFAHCVAVFMGCLCMLLYLVAPAIVVWGVVGIFALLKTMAAFGKCSALKIYGCMANGTCCRVGKKVRAYSKRE